MKNALLHNNMARVVLGTALILLIPLTAMQFTNEVQWTPFDFIVAASLLIGAGAIYEVATWRVRSSKRRTAIAVAVLAGLALVWVQLAVGIID